MNLNKFREFFNIPKKERAISLVLLLFINVGISSFYLFTVNSSPSEIKVYKNIVEKEDVDSLSSKNSFPTEAEKKGILLVNKMTTDNWSSEGFSKKQIKMILSFKSKIGSFKNTTDLSKVYCISDKYISNNKNRFVFKTETNLQYEKLDSSQVDFQSDKKKEYEEKRILDLNSSSEEELLKVYGIGPKLSNRILKYRDLLGGFNEVSQLKEVYGLNQKSYDLIAPNFQIYSEVKKININTADFKELIRHPYIDKSTVKAILNYKELHGEYSSISDLKKIYSISDSIFVKIQDYIKIK